MQVQIRFTAQGSNTYVGGFTHGDVARVGEALARHLVDEARVAEYVLPPVSHETDEPGKAETAAKRAKKPRPAEAKGDVE